MKKLKLLFLFILVVLFHSASANDTTIFNNENIIQSIGKDIQILSDETNTLTFDDVFNSKDFKLSTENVPNLGISKSTHWVRFSIKNELKNRRLLLQLQYPIIDEI